MAKPKNKNAKQKRNNREQDAKGKTKKKKYRVRNWPEYNEMLKQRGALDVWIEECALESWQAQPTGKRGSQPIYSDLAVKLTLQFGKVFHQRLRQTEGLMKSLFKIMKVDLDVPNYSTLSRRGGNISVNLPKSNRKKVILAADSSGLKVYGEGEWKVRKHGWSKRRTWRKMHLAITPDGEIRAADLTENSTADCDAIDDLFKQENADIDAFAGDGAYDTKKVYNARKNRNIKKVLIPPQRNAKIFRHGNSKDKPLPRDENLREIRKTSRRKWKENSGYHIRSLSETAMFRFKAIFGDKLNARNFNQQKTEFLIAVSALNKMTELGMPESYAVN